jgi:hypothetical protein
MYVAFNRTRTRRRRAESIACRLPLPSTIYLFQFQQYHNMIIYTNTISHKHTNNHKHKLNHNGLRQDRKVRQNAKCFCIYLKTPNSNNLPKLTYTLRRVQVQTGDISRRGVLVLVCIPGSPNHIPIPFVCPTP